MKTHKVHRYHDISAGHRVVGHESKCRHLHGHNYRVHFTCTAKDLDVVGRVIDFGVVKEKLCMWLENNWDHKFLIWEQDTFMVRAAELMSHEVEFGNSDFDIGTEDLLFDSLVVLPFNPTAENMARHLVKVIGPLQLEGTGVVLTEVLIEETAKCHASYGE